MFHKAGTRRHGSGLAKKVPKRKCIPDRQMQGVRGVPVRQAGTQRNGSSLAKKVPKRGCVPVRKAGTPTDGGSLAQKVPVVSVGCCG